MSRYRRSLRAAIFALACSVAMAPAGAFGAQTAAQSQLARLEPYQLVRSLRMLQDQVVAGKPEALAMLNRVLVRIAEQLRTSPPDVWSRTDNLHAAVIYLLNGGNPDVVRPVLAAAPSEALPPRLIAGALAYADANSGEVLQQFSDPLPPELPKELVASIYLVTSPQLATSDPAMALKRLDMIRLTMPGSLFEEAAIRRSLRIAARLHDAGKVNVLSRNYLQRFPHSPYAQDFFPQFVDALLQLKDRLGNDEIAELVRFASPAAQHALYLRLARGALLDGQMERARFAAARAAELAAELHLDDTQAKLYSAASKAASMRAQDAMHTLSEIPKERLHERDRRLLEAAEAMAGRVIQEPAQATARPAAPPKVESIPVSTGSEAGPSWAQEGSEPDTAIQDTVDETKKKLAEIDRLLGRATQ
ncbi:hypothetical protein ATN84_13895 [Paramesorhizobium deserti]|uniref:Chemotaxis protein MotC n=1 Tax=Paramesorhizobium deserti TaxID=1494590 RepID=A0A135HS49_9HYPH|nr:hypothetical protein [Paramesorhizobium deserti]KXF76015.1 hypothetical protein ATN84_13895 [Paramesorhizobium deserti]